MTENDDLLSQIKKFIEPMYKRLDNLDTTVAHNTTAIEAFRAGQDDIRDRMATHEDIHDVRVDVVKKLKDHEERIENLEELTHTPNPHKH